VEAELWFVEEHGGRTPWLEQGGGDTDEAERAIGELVCEEGIVGISLLPF
jgi:hypothetical protein